VLNATYLTRYLKPDFETLLVVGEKEAHEKSADFLAEQMGVEYTTIGGMERAINPASDYFAYQRLKYLIKRFKPDIVHTHAAKPGALGRMAAAAMKVPVIVHTFHGHVFHSYFNSVKTNLFINTERYLARKSDAIIAISDQQKRELVNDFKIAPENKFRTVRLGLDLDKFRVNQAEKRYQFRQEFGLKDDDIAIGIIGRLVPIKNHQLFIDGINHVLKSSSKKIKAFIVGDGETRPDLEKQALDYQISFSTHMTEVDSSSLVFTSWRSDIDSINAGLDIVALTSFNEGTPVSLIEAQAANKAIVSTRVGGIQDVVVDGKTALLSDPDDTSSFCSNLLQLVEDDQLRDRLSQNSRHFVMENFSYQRLISDMSGLYYELLDKKRVYSHVLV
jgi:glycosyltransferase involved in cell wall biosynthesis